MVKSFKKLFKFKKIALMAGMSVLFAPLFLSLSTIHQQNNLSETPATASLNDATDKATRSTTTQTFTKKIDLSMVDGWFNNEYYGVWDLSVGDVRLFGNQYVKNDSQLNEYGGVYGSHNYKYWLEIGARDGKVVFDMPEYPFSDTTVDSLNSKNAQWAIGFHYWVNQYSDPDVFKHTFTNTGGSNATFQLSTHQAWNLDGCATFLSSYRNECKATYFEGVFQSAVAVWSNQGGTWNQNAAMQMYFFAPYRQTSNFKYLGNLKQFSDEKMFLNYDNQNQTWKYINYPNGNGWRSIRMVMGLYDGKLWFVDSTNINNSKSSAKLEWAFTQGQKVPLTDFLRMDSSELPKYFSVTLKNTPSNCYTSEPDKIKIDLVNDPTNSKVVAKLTIPKSYVPGFGFNSSNNAVKTQWIETTDMTTTLDLPYDEYFILDDVPNTALNTDFFTDETNYYAYNVTNLNYIPTLDYSNIEAIKNDLLEAILGFWTSTLWTNLPNSLSTSNASISIDESTSNYADGEVVVNQLSLNTYYENNRLINGTAKNFITSDKPLKLTGFNRLPTELNTTNTTVGSLSVQDNVIVWDASGSNIFSDYANTLPSNFNTDVIDVQFLKNNNIFINLPSEFDSATYSFIEKQPNDIDGTLIVKFNLNNFNNQYGELQTEAQTFTIKFVGLKKADTTWNTNFLTDDGTYSYELSPYDKLQNNIFNRINEQIIQNAINENLQYYLPNIKDGESLVVDSIELNQTAGSVAVAAHLEKSGAENVALPQLTITNFVFAPIVAKTETISSDLFPAEFLWSIKYSYDELGLDIENTQTDMINKLSTLYDGIDANKYEISIDINQCNANNLSGLLSLQMNVKYKDAPATEINLVNSFKLSKTGVSRLAKTYYVDETRTSEELYQFLDDSYNVTEFFNDVSNGIVDIDSLPTLGEKEYTLDNLTISDNKVITADVRVKSAVSYTSYFSSVGSETFSLGTITLVGNDYANSNLNQTTISQSYNYLTDERFVNVKTPSQFQTVVNENRNDQDFLKLLVNVLNAPENAMISIDDGIINNNTITYSISVSPYVDEYGELQNTNLTIECTYTLPYGDDVTIVNNEIQLDASKYAFEYDTEQLLALNVIDNLPSGVVPSIEIDEVNNLTRSISATVSASQYYDESGAIQNNLRAPVIFTNAKKVQSWTDVQRNQTEIEETINDFKIALEQKDKTIIEKYLTITPTDYDVAPVEWEIGEFTEVENKLGIFNVTINLTNNYFKNDNKYTFITDNTSTSFNVEFEVYPKTDTVEQIVGKELTVTSAAEAGLDGLSNQVYSIDFEDEFSNQLENAFKNNLTTWFSNARGLSEQLGNRDFIQPNSISITYGNSDVTINAQVLGWNASLNPDDALEPVDVTVTIEGFNISQTTAVETIDISTVSALNTLTVNDVTDENLKTYIESNKNSIFNNYPNKMTIASVSITERQPANSSVVAAITVNNAKLDDGYGEKTFNVTFSGFQPLDGLTTIIPSTIALDGLNQMLPSEVVDHLNEIKQAIIDSGSIENIANDETLTVGDIDIEILTPVSNTTGELQVVLTIKNNKYWENGVTDETYTTNVTLTGFKIQLPTAQKQSSKTDSSFSNQFASQFNEDAAQTYMDNNKNYFFENLAPNVQFRISNLTPNESGGYVTFDVSLNPYYNENGILTENDSNPYQITLRGFKTDGLTTNVPSRMALRGVDTILASDVTDNQAVIITAIINGQFITSTNGDLTDADLSFTVINDTADNVKSKLQVNLTISNDKYWSNGIAQSTYEKAVTLTGFKQQKATNFSAPISVDGETVQEREQNLTQGIENGDIKLNEAPYYIPDTNNDGQVDLNDVEIVIEDDQLFIVPNKIYNDKGILTDNTNQQKLLVNEAKNPNVSSSEFKLEGWLVIVIIASSIGLIFLVILLILLAKYLSNKRHLNDDTFVYE